MKTMFVFLVFVQFVCGSGGDRSESGKPETTWENQEHPPVPLPPKESLREKGNLQENPDSLSDVTYSVKIPSGLDIQGKNVREGVKWRDRNGSNFVIITETDEIARDGDNRDKYIYGYQFKDDGNGWQLLWKIQDYVTECPVDIKVSYIRNSLKVTDLDNDGVGETTFLYLLSCRGDVSPEGLKLIMHEGDKKFAIRGETKIKIKSTGEQYGGKMTVDKSFDDAPKSFLDYAIEQWRKYQLQEY